MSGSPSRAAGIIDLVPCSASPRPRLRARRLAGAAAALALLLTGCTGGGHRPEPGNPDAEAAEVAGPNPEATGAVARGGSPPELHGERALAIRPGRRVFVQPSCTPDADGTRACWGETGNPIARGGSRSPTRPCPSTTWGWSGRRG